MIRFIVKQVDRDQGHVSSRLLTLEMDCPKLERLLSGGGSGGGPNGDDWQYYELVGAEVRREGTVECLGCGRLIDHKAGTCRFCGRKEF